MKYRQTGSDKVVGIAAYLFSLLIVLVMLPFLYIIAVSMSKNSM